METNTDMQVVAPLWHQCVLILRNRIYNGFYEPGQPLNGENKLAAELGVSRITIRRALEYLASEGLVIRRQGRRTYVKPGLPSRARAATGFLEDLINLFQATRLAGYSIDESKPPSYVTDFFGSEDLIHIRRMRTMGGTPFSVADTYLPRNVAKRLDPTDLRRLQILEILESKLGASVKTAEQHIGAVGAPTDIAKFLGLRPGSPVMRLDLHYYSEDGLPIAYSRVYIHGDRHVYSVRLFRRPGLPGA
jgi:GntR family transcriptional regulator